MRLILLIGLVFLILTGCQPTEGESPGNEMGQIADDYIESWARFYPTSALTAGRLESAVDFEDLSPSSIDAWVAASRNTYERIQRLPAATTLDERIDREILTRRSRLEIFLWEEVQAHRINPQISSNLVNHALTTLLVRTNLDEELRLEAVEGRLSALQTLCETTRKKLASGQPTAIAASVRDLRSTATFFREGLLSALGLEAGTHGAERLASIAGDTAAALDGLAAWIETSVRSVKSDAFGAEYFGRALALTYGADLTPTRLERLALDEIVEVRRLMNELATRWWIDEHGGLAPTDFNKLVAPRLTEMEAFNTGNQTAFLAEFQALIDRSERFLRERDLVDLPEKRTLHTALSPEHFAGAAVGGVYPAGPFDPEAETLFYLPSVPDDAPTKVRDGFYRSFNTAFDTMIITHEIYPGHYLQLKAAAHHPSPIRPLFAGDDFTEGWATFCEQMTLDAGWDDDRPMTRMAHLRKRLENAVRAYVSVQVHCRGWKQEQLTAFAVDTGLLPPQFAENLWFRAVLTPIQLPSYFIGYRVFDEIYEREAARLGEAFSVKEMNNAVMSSGGVPLEFLDEVLAAAHPVVPDP